VGIDNYSPYYSVELKEKRLEALKIRKIAKVIECDISNFDALSEIFKNERPQYVFNLAAQAGVRLSLEESSQYLSANVTGFENVLRCSSTFGCEGLIYASSSSVYGDSSSQPFSERAFSLRPKSIYGTTKLMNELFAENYSRITGLKTRGLRFFTVYGPWGRPDMAYFRLASAALNEETFNLFGEGDIQRDFTYIDDVVEKSVMLLVDLVSREQGFSDLVNIGGKRPISMNRLIELVAEKSRKEIRLSKQPESVSDSKITIADNSYLEEIIGAFEFTLLEVGIEKLVSWAESATIREQLQKWIRSTNP
jgi:UDP-glucuronate 4-epimerase